MGVPAAARIRTLCHRVGRERPPFAPRKAFGTALRLLRVTSCQVPILNLSVLLHCTSATGQISALESWQVPQLVRRGGVYPLGLSDSSPRPGTHQPKSWQAPTNLPAMADSDDAPGRPEQGHRLGRVWFPSLRSSPPPRGGHLGQSAPEWGNTEVVPGWVIGSGGVIELRVTALTPLRLFQ